MGNECATFCSGRSFSMVRCPLLSQVSLGLQGHISRPGEGFGQLGLMVPREIDLRQLSYHLQPILAEWLAANPLIAVLASV